MATHYEVRYAASPKDVKNYDTERLRSDFLIDNLFVFNNINLVYSHFDKLLTSITLINWQVDFREPVMLNNLMH